MKTTAIIPVAGEGTRLRPHTYSTPKVLINVAGKAMISHILDRLVEAGIDDIVFVIGHMGGEVREFVQRNYDFNARFVEQAERKGLGHAVYLARELTPPGPVLIVLGDTLFRADLRKVLGSPVSLIAVMETDDPKRYGIVKLDGARVVGIIEKPADPPSNLAVIGIYYIPNSAVLFGCLEEVISEGLKTKGEYQLTDALALMTERGERLEVFKVDGWYDCGKKETLLRTNRELLELDAVPVSIEGSAVLAPVAVHPEAVVVNSVIGPYVTVARGARIQNSVIRNSIIAERSTVQNACLESSVIGPGVSVKSRPRMLNIGDSSEVELA
jgi:glucose-1-phosphate thymidylyltransferase